jgi:tetratricopeptide (TPR) repeat protein
MTMKDRLSIDQLLRRGQAAARVGQRDEAREYLRRVVELDPGHIQAWLDLAGVEDDPAQKRICFETVLTLEPNNEEAQLGLEMLGSRQEVPVPAGAAAQDELEAVISEASRRLEEAVGPPPAGEVPLDDGVLYCVNHPNVETMLRCNRCGRPVCTRCVVQTPVGYRCRQCVGQQQAVFYTGGAVDYVLGGIIGLVLGGVASYLITLTGLWFIALILGPTIGIGIAEAVRLAVRRRRSRYLWLVVAGAMLLGAVPALLVSLMSIWSALVLGLFLVLAVGAAAARLR